MAKQSLNKRRRKNKLFTLVASSDELREINEKAEPSPHGLIRNKMRNPDSVGTIGGYMKDEFGDVYGMTCFHVSKHNTADWNNIADGESKEIVNDKGTIGTIDGFNKFNNKIDVSFVKIQNPANVNNQFIGNPSGTYNITDSDIKTLEVQLYSDKQKKKIEGFLVKAYKNDEISLILKENGQEDKFVDLIAVSSSVNNGKSLTVPGDSGVWVRRKSDNKLIGMVIGSDFHNEVTYVIKMKTILDYAKVYSLF